jgi:gamma-glutamylputrescine oxidase
VVYFVALSGTPHIMFSYWEQQQFFFYDHIVIGAGIVGLNVALELRRRYQDASILVLERGLLPTGASTRNAGFACMGSVTELLDDVTATSEAETVQLFHRRRQGLEKLRQRVGDAAMDYRAEGSYELIGEQELYALSNIDYLNELLKPVTKVPPFRVANELIEEKGFSKFYTKALIENTGEGALHSGKLMRALLQLAQQSGIEIKTGADVESFTEETKEVVVWVNDPARTDKLPLMCNTLSICTNAYTSKLLPGEDVKPGRGQVLVTAPLPHLKFKGIYHFDRGYYYFREIDGRVLIGGGRNLDFEAETTTDMDVTSQIQDALKQKLAEIILPESPFEVAMCWSGIMAFGPTRQPVVKAFSPRVFGAFRMGGMGVALACEVANELATLHEQVR